MAFSSILIVIIFTCSALIIKSSTSPTFDKKNSLNGINLIFATNNVPPYNIVNLNPNGNHTVGGSTTVVVEWLSKKLNFSYSYVFPKTFEDNNWVIDALAKKKADISSVGQFITLGRRTVMDFSFLMWSEPYTMVVPRQSGQLGRLLAFAEPFQSSVWLLILVISLAVTIAMSLFFKFQLDIFGFKSWVKRDGHPSRTEKKSATTFANYTGVHAMYLIGSLTNQGGGWTRASRLSFRVLLGIWLLAALVLVNSYSSTIISFLTVTRTRPSINNLDDLALSTDVRLVLMKNIVISQQILEGKSVVYGKLRNQIEKNPSQLVGNINNITALLLTKHFAFPYLESFSKFFISSRFKAEGKCHFYNSAPLPMFGMWFMPLQKNSPFTEQFTLGLMNFWETGLVVYTVNTLIPAAPECFVKIKPQTSALTPIKLGDLSGVFLLLGIGVSLSLISFTVEIVFQVERQGRRHNV